MAPTMDPADVPSTKSALPGSHPVSVAIACSAPTIQAPPTVPPPDSTSADREGVVMELMSTLVRRARDVDARVRGHENAEDGGHEGCDRHGGRVAASYH